MYRNLDSDKVIGTLEKLDLRIGERFPDSGLHQVCRELTEIGRSSAANAQRISRPNILIRLVVILIILAGVGSLIYIASILRFTQTPSEFFGFFQGIEAAMNTVVIVTAFLYSLTKIEEKWKRHRTLKALHELRSVIHVIDMHQLTKDPSSVVSVSRRTPNSPERDLTEFELMRYLDYCSEMLSLTSKLAVFYAQSMNDLVVNSAVNEIESLATNLSRKIWQKIMILHRFENQESNPTRFGNFPVID